MKFLLLFLGLLFVILACSENEDLYFTHLYGWVKSRIDSSGRNNMVLSVGDINPENPNQNRLRDTTSAYNSDSLPGFFEMDSVCFATSSRQGSEIVGIAFDSTKNSGWPTQFQFFDLYGPVDTVIYYLSPYTE